MDISDKLIIVCIIFAILAILSIIFGCFYFSSKPENFKNNKSKEAFIIEEMVDLFKNKSEDFKIIEMMKKHTEQFKNEKFVKKLLNVLTKEEAAFTDKPNKPNKPNTTNKRIKPNTTNKPTTNK